MDVAFLVVGDPFGATTHTDLVLRAKQKNIQVQVVHNASIMNAVGCCGLQLYSFGETISIPFWTEEWKPDSYYDRIIDNYQRGLHTLCLLDIKVKEPTLESMVLKKKVYMPPKFMSVSVAASQLLQTIEKRSKSEEKNAGKKFKKFFFQSYQNLLTQAMWLTVLSPESLAVGLARVGSNDQKIIACSLSEMEKTDLGPPLHCLVIPSESSKFPLHPLEIEYLTQFALDAVTFQERVGCW